MSIPIDEIFGLANQGEGTRMGVPSIFIRTGGCNLSCPGFNCKTTSPLDGSSLTGCDSIHAVNAKHFKHTWTYYDKAMDLVKDVIKYNIVRKEGNTEKPDIIFTGGEPLLHHSDPVMIGTVEYFISRGHKVYFESNGTIDIDFHKFDIYKNVSFSISVKMSSSGEPIGKRWKPEVVNNYLRYTNDSYFKFVLSKESIKTNSNEVFEFLNLIPTFSVVYVMPLGETKEEIELNAKDVYEFALTHGFRYSDRLHIRIYNNLRGV